MNFVFDVDGTLTPSRGKIDPCFEQFFIEFCHRNTVYLVTGSDFAKTLEQLGNNAVGSVAGIFPCSGNQFLKRVIGVADYKLYPAYEHVYQNDFTPSEELLNALDKELLDSGFSVRTGNHIENRIGTINFSIVGRNANKEERQIYVAWDEATNERVLICKRLSEKFPDLEFVVGGETGIDIYPIGKNKAQIRQYIEGPIMFFGDRCEPGGNDYPLASIADVVYNVKNWEQTEYILRMQYAKLRSE